MQLVIADTNFDNAKEFEMAARARVSLRAGQKSARRAERGSYECSSAYLARRDKHFYTRGNQTRFKRYS
jgi:hypothetical protein